MRLPVRKSTLLRQRDDDAPIVTASMVEHWKRQLYELEVLERPKIVADLSHALSLGDFSENAEYQDAKARLSRIDGRIFSLGERLKRAVIISSAPNTTGTVQLGSTVTVRVDGKERTYRIVGPHESSPTHGRISHVSPLGVALMHHAVGDTVSVSTERGAVSYAIVKID